MGSSQNITILKEKKYHMNNNTDIFGHKQHAQVFQPGKDYSLVIEFGPTPETTRIKTPNGEEIRMVTDCKINCCADEQLNSVTLTILCPKIIPSPALEELSEEDKKNWVQYLKKRKENEHNQHPAEGQEVGRNSNS